MKNDPYIVSEEAHIIILDGNSDVCMANNDKDTNHPRHIVGRVNFVRNEEKWKIHKIDWCEGGL